MNITMSEKRHQRAFAGLAGLGDALADREVMSVQCSHSHHVAAVYDTSAGLTYRTITGPHAHGRKDRADVAHHGHEHGEPYAELLDDPNADDVLPGWCDCGLWSLSRADLLTALKAGERTTRVG